MPINDFSRASHLNLFDRPGNKSFQESDKNITLHYRSVIEIPTCLRGKSLYYSFVDASKHRVIGVALPPTLERLFCHQISLAVKGRQINR